MKKISSISILIFSVFFLYNTAFAFVTDQGTATITTGGTVDNFTGVNVPMVANSQRLCQGIYPTCTTDFGSSGINLGWLHVHDSTDVEAWSATTKTDGDYFLAFYSDNYFGGDSEYFTLNRTGGVWTVVGSSSVADGITSQLTPVASSTVPYNVTFTGKYNNSGTYRTIIATTTTGAPSIYASTSATLTTGTGVAYTLPIVLSPNQTYSYTMIMCDYSGMSCTTPTASISFSTNGLTGAISPPTWTAEACTWTDFSTWTGCLDNVFHDLFSPSSESLNQYQGLYAQFVNKPPFGYVIAIQSAIASINDTASSPFTLQSMPVLNTYIFDPIRLALIWVLWVAFAFIFYHRLKNIAL